MKKLLASVGLILCCTVMPVQKVEAQLAIVEVIKEAVKKVIVAVDLQIQRLQNETIWLQNAQKTLENEMSKLKMAEISDWVEKHRKLYDDYFKELWEVKNALASYQRIADIIKRQTQIIKEYKEAWALFQRDKNFTREELDHIYSIYSGMIEESVKNIDQLFLVTSAFVTQMSDAKRLEIINTVSDNLEQQYTDLRDFNNQNKVLSLQRAAERGEIEYVKRLYGLSW